MSQYTVPHSLHRSLSLACLTLLWACAAPTQSLDTPPACPPGQARWQGACLPDMDGDGIPNEYDLCPEVFDPEQWDDDEDGVGNRCDNCPYVYNPEQRDSNGDGVGDECSFADRDGDGILDADDNCPDHYNPGQEDTNGNGSGDACDDADRDGDGVPDAEDNCPDHYNPAQEDSSGNGIGDVCDTPDSDGDGILDHLDNCPAVHNPFQQDHDGDGVGDACEEQRGDIEAPFIITTTGNAAQLTDARDTSESNSSAIDIYPPHPQNESGPEYVYTFSVTQAVTLRAWLDTPEPPGVDIDLHLCASLEPLVVLERDDSSLEVTLGAGTYWLILDSYVTSTGAVRAGPYTLHVEILPTWPGTLADPIPLDGEDIANVLNLPFGFSDSRDTAVALSSAIDAYPPWDSIDESGPEYVYAFTIAQEAYFSASLVTPEPTGVDIDLHLLSSLEPVTAVARANVVFNTTIGPGTWYLVADTFGGNHNAGRYTLNVTLTPRAYDPQHWFNEYILAAVEYLYDNYGLLGYDSAVLTHDIVYGPHGVVPRTGEARTMCVAAAMEVILTAIELYAQEQGSAALYDHLPLRSWRYLGASDIKAHLWVNYSLTSRGSADALQHFGMGQNVPFEELVPGSFINLNRTTGTGHAVVFLNFIDIAGNESATWHEGVVGFTYFSAQGGYSEGNGGLDYRYAVFSAHGAPPMPYKRDLNVIYSTEQRLLNTGMMLHPLHWLPSSYVTSSWRASRQKAAVPEVGAFDPLYFDGVTADDVLE